MRPRITCEIRDTQPDHTLSFRPFTSLIFVIHAARLATLRPTDNTDIISHRAGALHLRALLQHLLADLKDATLSRKGYRNMVASIAPYIQKYSNSLLNELIITLDPRVTYLFEWHSLFEFDS